MANIIFLRLVSRTIHNSFNSNDLLDRMSKILLYRNCKRLDFLKYYDTGKMEYFCIRNRYESIIVTKAKTAISIFKISNRIGIATTSRVYIWCC